MASIPAPGKGSDSAMAWAEGSLWVGNYRDRKIHQIDPATGAIIRSIESKRSNLPRCHAPGTAHSISPRSRASA